MRADSDLLDADFGEHSKIVVPWGRVARRKRRPVFDREAVGRFVAEPPRLIDVDPSALRATQTWVLRHHVAYYLTGEWEATGRTSADMHQRANRYPLLYDDGRGPLIILAGHHRSMAALLSGRDVHARVVGRHGLNGVAVTPNLVVQRTDGAAIGRLEVERLTRDLARRGLTRDECAERIRFSRLEVRIV